MPSIHTTRFRLLSLIHNCGSRLHRQPWISGGGLAKDAAIAEGAYCSRFVDWIFPMSVVALGVGSKQGKVFACHVRELNRLASDAKSGA